MSVTVTVHEAETRLSKLLERVALGEEIIISKAGQPIARLGPLLQKKTRTPGGAEGLVVPQTFFEPLPEDILKALK